MPASTQTRPPVTDRPRAFPQMLDIGKIEVGDRFRKDVGDIESLKGSIERLGLLHPIVITKDHQLVAGARRLAAMRDLGHTQVPVNITDNLDTAVFLLEAERDENAERMEMAPSEYVALADRLADLMKPEAKARMSAGGKGVGKLPTPSGKGRDVVAKAVGVSDRTLRDAQSVVAAKDDPNPEVRKAAEKAAKEMDDTGKVNPAAKKVRAAKSDKANLLVANSP